MMIARPHASLLAVFLVTAMVLPVQAARTSTQSKAPRNLPDIAVYDPGLSLRASSQPNLKSSSQDSFNVYGGVRADGTNDRRPEGHFNTESWFPDLQNWTSVDLTEADPFWHMSQFNAQSLDVLTVPNTAMFSGVEAGEAGYTTAPGYGNNWDDWLDWRAQVSNPTVNTTLRLDFTFNHDTEPIYDFFTVQYDSAGTMIDWLSLDGANKDSLGVFTPVQFDQSLLYTPLMYSGTPRADIHLRMRVSSDGGWSDEDGLWPTRGAAQVDNIRVRFNGTPVTAFGDGTATFEAGDTDGWIPTPSSFVGDFGKVFPRLDDIDPCAFDPTPQIGFIDDGTPPKNAPQMSTGGTLSPSWSYGIAGGWVTNYTGGLTFGANSLNNEFRSPEILWDDPGSTEDDPLQGGATIRFSVWQHLLLENGIFWLWNVRAFDGSAWGPWQNRNFVYYGGGVPAYVPVEVDVSDLIAANNPEKVQLSLGAVDLADLFGFPGNDATPSPTFDNVSVWRYEAPGPSFSIRQIEMFHDTYPNSGAFDYEADPSAMSCRLDIASDISTGLLNVAGDSLVADVVPGVPGTTLTGPGSNGLPVIKWLLQANPDFNSERIMPPGAVNLGGNLWSGTTDSDSVRTPGGATVADRFAFDLPNDGPAVAAYQANEDPMFFPGDILRYCLIATDSGGNTTTLPADTTGFMSGVNYSRVFTVRALPTLDITVLPVITLVEQPEILWINDFGHRGNEAEVLQAFEQNGLFEGEHFDTYTVRGPSSIVGNGIGSSGVHGATADQLRGYNCIVYTSGNLTSGLLSDGSDANGNDKGADVQVLTAWHGQAANRYAVFFGDEIGTGLTAQGGTTLSFLNNVLGVDLAGPDVRPEIGGQTATVIAPTGDVPGAFAQNFVAYGGCFSVNRFDSLRPLPGSPAVRGHEFLTPLGGSGSYSAAASVWHERTENINGTDFTRIDVTFPFGFLYVYDDPGVPNPTGKSSRAVLLDELLSAFAHPQGGNAVNTDPARRPKLVLEGNHPNPFNPMTTIRFEAPARGRVDLRIYDVRGQLVRTLVDGEVPAGRHSAVWDGTDDRGQSVASGIYLYRIEGFGSEEIRKMALVK